MVQRKKKIHKEAFANNFSTCSFASLRFCKSHPASATRTISYEFFIVACFVASASRSNRLMRFRSTAFFDTVFPTTIPNREDFPFEALAFKRSFPCLKVGCALNVDRKSLALFKRCCVGRAMKLCCKTFSSFLPASGQHSLSFLGCTTF